MGTDLGSPAEAPGAAQQPGLSGPAGEPPPPSQSSAAPQPSRQPGPGTTCRNHTPPGSGSGNHQEGSRAWTHLGRSPWGCSSWLRDPRLTDESPFSRTCTRTRKLHSQGPGLESSRVWTVWTDLEVVPLGVCDVTGHSVCVAHPVAVWSAPCWAGPHGHVRALPSPVDLQPSTVWQTHLRAETRGSHTCTSRTTPTRLCWTGLVGSLTGRRDDAPVGEKHLSGGSVGEHEHGGTALLLHQHHPLPAAPAGSRPVLAGPARLVLIAPPGLECTRICLEGRLTLAYWPVLEPAADSGSICVFHSCRPVRLLNQNQPVFTGQHHLRETAETLSWSPGGLEVQRVWWSRSYVISDGVCCLDDQWGRGWEVLV